MLKNVPLKIVGSCLIDSIMIPHETGLVHLGQLLQLDLGSCLATIRVVVVGAGGPDVSSTVSSALVSGNGISIHRDCLESQLFLAAMEGAEGDLSVSEAVEEPLFTNLPVLGRPPRIGV